MRRSVIALILCSLVLGLATLAAAGAGATDDATRGPISIHVRDADLREIVQTVLTSTGASIVLVGDVSGTITLDEENVAVDRLLEAICQAKGFHWWCDQDGTYFISTRERPAPTVEQVAAAPANEAEPSFVSRMYTLRFASPQYISWLFGGSDDPGPEPYVADSSLLDMGPVLPAQPGGAAPLSGGLGELRGAGGFGGGGGGGGGFGGGGGGGAAGGGGAGGSLGQFMPPGVEAPVAFPMLNALLIRSTSEEGMNEFIEFIKLLDRKPQQIIIELQSVEVSNLFDKEMGIDWYWITGSTSIENIGFTTSATLQIGYSRGQNFQAALTYLIRTGRGRVVDAIRIATMNLLPAVNEVVVSYPIVEVGGVAGGPLGGGGVQTITITYQDLPTSLTIVPRINGDGTITMTIPFTKTVQTGEVPVPIANFGSQDLPIWTTTNLLTTVNVRDGETFVVGGFVGKTVIEGELRLPILSDIPIIGEQLFTRRSRSVTDSETLIFITPRIIREEAAPATLGPI